MARPMNTLPSSESPLVDFATKLRGLHDRAGRPTLEVMAARSGISTAGLSQAHSGRVFPSWRTVHGYVTACGGSLADWRRYWESVRLAQQPRGPRNELVRQWARMGKVVPPRQVGSEAELIQILDSVRAYCGLSLRQLAKGAAGYSHHTFGELLRKRRPCTVDILHAFLSSCGVGQEYIETWLSLLTQVRPSESVAAARLLEKRRTSVRKSSSSLMYAVEEMEKWLASPVTALRAFPSAELKRDHKVRATTVEVLRRLEECLIQPHDTRMSIVANWLAREVSEGRAILNSQFIDELLDARMSIAFDRRRVRRALHRSAQVLESLNLQRQQQDALGRAA